MNRALLAFVMTGLIAAFSSLGCGADEELPDPAAQAKPAQLDKPVQATPAPAPQAMPQQDEASSAEVAANVAARLGQTVDLPEFYPEDGPVYPGAKPSHVQQLPNGKVSVVFGTDTPVEEAAKVMSEASEAKGWTIASEDMIERGFLARGTKDGRNLMILTNRVSDGAEDEAVTLVAVSIDP